MDRPPDAPPGIVVHLACRRDGIEFTHRVLNDVNWLADHWHGTFTVTCPHCGADHAYETKSAYLSAAMSRERPLTDILSREQS